MRIRSLSDHAQRAHLDALYRNRYYAALCTCGHQRRQHGQVKCFALGCTCRVWYPPPPTQTEAKEREEQILKELGY